MTKREKILGGILLSIVVLLGVVQSSQPVSAARVAVTPIVLELGSIYPRVSTDTLGSFLNIWSAGYFNNVIASSTTVGTTTTNRIVGNGIPTIATSTGAGAVAGTSTPATGSNDLGGSVYLVTGSAPAANQTIWSVAFGSSTPAAQVFCVVSPGSLTASQLSVASSTFVATTTTGFALKSGSVGLIATTTYLWHWNCH